MVVPARLQEDDVACWLLKTRGPLSAVPVVPGEVSRARRCVRPSYRLGLMRPGAPCALWLSGRDAGVRAVGRLVAAPGADDAVEVELLGLHHPVPRRELLVDARFRGAEVVRMAAGSNPSYLDAAAWAAVRERLEPQAGTGDLEPQAGTGDLEPQAGTRDLEPQAPMGDQARWESGWSGRRESNSRS